MPIELVVHEPFGTPEGKMFMRGDEITDPATIDKVLAGWASHVVKRQAMTPAPASPVEQPAPADPAVTSDTDTGSKTKGK